MQRELGIELPRLLRASIAPLVLPWEFQGTRATFALPRAPECRTLSVLIQSVVQETGVNSDPVLMNRFVSHSRNNPSCSVQHSHLGILHAGTLLV
jgi:hypothetical protein